MGSSRLPGKVVCEIAGKPMLAWVVERARRALTLDEVVVATSTHADDDPIETFCQEEEFFCFRGSMHDVLDRYYQAACALKAEILVRITGDCPFIDPGLIDATVGALWDNQKESTRKDRFKPTEYPSPIGQTPRYDFTANRLPPPWGRTYPIGLDVEVCTFDALEIAWREASEPHHREHVMPFLYENTDRFKIRLINHKIDYGDMRWTVDTPQDLKLVRQVASHFQDDSFSWLDIIALFERAPELADINADVQHKTALDVDERTQ